MPTLQAGSIDAIITDLPYGTTACEWDSIIPLDEMWKQVKILLKAKGAFMTTASQPFTGVLVISNIDYFSDEWIWKKTKATRYLSARSKPMKEHESVLVFSSGSTTYNPQLTKGKPYRNHHRPGDSGDVYGNNNNIFINDGFRFPKTILEIDNEWNPEHPTQKPVALYEYLIRTYTNPGETVLDICMGSGTTGVAAIQTDRNFIGIEKEKKFFEIAKRRIEQAPPPLFT